MATYVKGLDADGSNFYFLIVTGTGANTGSPGVPGHSLVDATNTSRVAVVSAGGALLTDASATTQPVSVGSLPLPTGAAADATLTGGTAKTRIVDASNATRLATVSAGGALLTDASATTQPVSVGSLPLPTGAATDATLTGGTLKSIIRGGTKGTTNTNTDITHTASGVNHEALDVVIYDVSGNPITSFGGSGGTASTLGNAIPNTATAAGWSDGTNMQMPRVFDTNTNSGTEYVAGVVLRISTSSGSVEGGTSSNPVRVDVTGSTTQPVSAASLPLPTGAAADATLTGGTAKTRLVDASNTTRLATISSGGALLTDASATTQPVSVGSLPLPTGAAADATLTGGTAKTRLVDATNTSRLGTVTSGGALLTDASATTQPVSAASLPLPTGAALDATLTGGTAKSIVRGGTKGTTNTNSDITHTAAGSNHESLDVSIYDTAGNLLGTSSNPFRSNPVNAINRKAIYASAVNATITLNSLNTSNTLLTGEQSTAIDNSTNLYEDYFLSGKVKTGTSPTAGQVEVWVIPEMDDANWPDTVGGSDAAVTLTSTNIKNYAGALWATIVTDSTNNQAYPLPKVSVASLFGSKICPRKFVLFVTHNTGVALNSANNQLTVEGVYGNQNG